MKAAKSTFKIIFYLRKDKMKKNSFTPIFCRVTISGESVSFNIHTDIHSDMWDSTASQAKGKTREAIQINNLLDSCKTSLRNMYRDIFERERILCQQKS